MELLTFIRDGEQRLGAALDAERVLDLGLASGDTLPTGMVELIAAGPAALEVVRRLVAEPTAAALLDHATLTLCAPIPHPARNVFCVGRNYLDHVAEGDRVRQVATELPEWPQFFTKPPQAVIGPGAPIPAHAGLTGRLDYEVELALVIGRAGRDIAEAEAMAHVFGATIANDITARDLQRRHGQWFKGKGLDGSCPMGPVLVTADALDLTDLEVSLTVNGEPRQRSRTSRMIFPIPTIIAQLSAGMTLLPGDVILTGTPEGVGYAMDPPRYLRPGDRIAASIEGIGTLENTVA